MAKLVIPSLLSFSSSFNLSPGAFCALFSFPDSDEAARKVDARTLPGVPIERTSIRGTISNYSGGDEATILTNLEKEKGSVDNANLQRVDKASLPQDSDTLVISFSLVASAQSIVPYACNEEDYYAHLKQFTDRCKKEGVYRRLAERYLMNTLRGEFCWRNNSCAQNKCVKINDDLVVFASELDHNLSPEEKLSVNSINVKEKRETAAIYVDQLTESLSESGKVLVMNVVAMLQMGMGSTVFPSQEFSEEDSRRPAGKFKVSKILYKLPGNKADGNQAGFHSQKIGNAIRRIDTWYPDYKINQVALPIEPYGQDQSILKAYRAKHSLYEFMEKLDVLTAETKTTDNHAFVLACLIRGGVFSGEAKKKKGDKPKPAEDQLVLN